MPRLPPQEGFQNAPLKSPLRDPPVRPRPAFRSSLKLWLVNPDLRGCRKRLRRFANKAFRMNAVSGVQNGAALFDGGGRQTMVNHGRAEQAESGMAMLLVVPGEELLAEGPGVLQRPEAFRESRPVFQSPEMAFRIRVIVGNMRAAVGFGDAQIRHQEGDGLRCH